MKTSTQRILTTHVGSLPRPPDLLALILAKEQGAPFDAELYASQVKSAIAEVVKKQAEAGIDIVADGEPVRVYSLCQRPPRGHRGASEPWRRRHLGAVARASSLP